MPVFKPWTPEALASWAARAARAVVEDDLANAEGEAVDPLTLPDVEHIKIGGTARLTDTSKRDVERWGQRYDRTLSLPRIERAERKAASDRAKTMQQRFAAQSGYLNKPREAESLRPMNAKERSKLKRAAKHHAKAYTSRGMQV